MKTCDKCMKYDICGKREVFGAVGCVDDFQQKPQTNANKIRSMSDEELAEFIQDIWCDNHGYFVDKLLSKSANPICILEMLQSEVENGN